MGPFTMRWKPDLLVAAVILGSCVTAYAQEPPFGIGKPATPADVRAADTTIGPEGKELPPGSGTAAQGAAIFGLRGCTRCHGPTQVEGPAPRLATEEETASPGSGYYSLKYWPFAPVIFDYIRRAMPYDRPGFLSADEAYALTAFLLFRNGIIQEDDVMDATSLPKVRMPNRDRFVPPPADWKPGRPRPFVVKPGSEE